MNRSNLSTSYHGSSQQGIQSAIRDSDDGSVSLDERTAVHTQHPSQPVTGVSAELLSQRAQRVSSRQLRISCVVPAKNEAQQIAQFVTELGEYLSTLTDVFEIVLVDDGSSDETLVVAAEAMQRIAGCGQLVSLSRNFGKEAAIAAGLAAARGEVVVIMDADFQHPFATIENFIGKWQLGYDHVYATKSDSYHESAIRAYGRRLFHTLQARSSTFTIPQGAEDFRLLDRKVVLALNSCTEQDKFMKGLYAFVGFRCCAVKYARPERRAGESHFGGWRLARFAISGFLSFSTLPLRIWGFIGFAISLLSFCCACYIVLKTLIMGVQTPGYATLLVTVVFFGGIQLLSIGVLGEYIARIFREVKPRPAYIVQQRQQWGDTADSVWGDELTDA